MKKNNSLGHTLVEIMVVTAIIGAVIIIVPPMLQWMRQQGVHHAATQIQADLQLARVLAIRQKQICSLRFNSPDTNQYFNTINERRTDLGAYFGGVHFLDRGPDDMPMASDVDFNRQGMSCSVIPADIFISDAEGMTTYRIRVLLPGGISMYRWDGHQWH